MVKCSVVIPCRDGEAHLRATLDSLTAQTVDVHVTVVDDHSQDKTPEILADFPWVNVIRYPKREKKGYDRIGMLCNLALGVMPEADVYMVSGDDQDYPPDYIERVVDYMDTDGVAIASGHARGPKPVGAPDGSGRIFTAEIWARITPFHESPGWESGPLLQARFMGYEIRKYPVKKKHLRPKAKGSLRRYGHGAYTLGRPLTWTIFRVINDILRGRKAPGRAISILVGHLEYIAKRKPKVEYAMVVRAWCWGRMTGKIKSVLMWPIEKLKGN